MIEEKIICIGCPMGCQATLKIDEQGEIIKVTGCKCKSGRQWVVEEYRNPVRVLTATVLTEGSLQPLLPVRTNKPIVKTKLLEAATILAKVRVSPPIRAGQVILPNLLNTGANVVASSALS
jgi:CxxC motif-containing protein